MKSFFYIFLFLFLANPVLSEVSFARFLQKHSFIKDRFFGGIEINLRLSQGVPYKISFLKDPASLVIDFNVLNFTDVDPEKLNRSKNIKFIKFQEIDSDWSRLSVQFEDYWDVENTEMKIDPNDNSALIAILLKPISEEVFRTKNLNGDSLLKNKNWKVTKKNSVITNSEFIVVLDPGHGGNCLLYTSPSPRD